MGFNDMMGKIRHLDNLTAKWLMRHFYFTFFQVVLVSVFVFWFINTINILDLSYQTSNGPTIERIGVAQTINTNLIVFLLLLNSFWILYIFNICRRGNNILKDIAYNISKMRHREKDPAQKNNQPGPVKNTRNTGP
ncbi:MAG: hypothetical protein HQL27_01900 [Candidatus Omnitrophica bacterium]|nr:hypothetical protein [Candidatus Omnitrophota bacterium]